MMAEAGSLANCNSRQEEETIISTKIRDGVQQSELPPNVLQMIFSLLDLPSKKNVVLVRKKWRELAYHKNVWKNVFAKVDFNKIINRKVFMSFESRGMRRIYVYNLSAPARKLRVMFRSVPSLQELEITCYNDVSDENLYILHKFPNLRTLELSYAYKITNETLKVVGRSLKELTTLSLSSCDLITDVGISYLTGTDDKDGIQGSLNLKNLTLLSCSEISNESMKMISSKLLKLTKLEVRGCKHVRDRGVIFLSGGAKWDHIPGTRNLEELDLSDIGGIFDLSLQQIASGLPVLNTLNISWNRQLTKLAFTYLAKMTCLKTLNMSFCDVKGGGLVHLVKSNIIVLDLTGNGRIGVKGLRHIAGMSHLQELHLRSCEVNDQGLEILSKCPSKMTLLNLNGNRITDAGMVYLGKMVHLEELDLSMCQKITSVGLLQLSQLVPQTVKLKFEKNFKKTLKCLNQIVRNVEENDIGSEDWLKAVRRMGKMENMFDFFAAACNVRNDHP